MKMQIQVVLSHILVHRNFHEGELKFPSFLLITKILTQSICSACFFLTLFAIMQ